jgi:hypothetical protein
MLTCITFTTPGTFSASVASKLFTSPLATGQRSIIAVSMPGSWMSAPYFSFPVTMSAASLKVSRIFSLLMYRHCAGFLSAALSCS